MTSDAGNCYPNSGAWKSTLASKTGATDRHGRFRVERGPGYPADLRVVAKGGSVVQLVSAARIRTFDDELVADVRDGGTVQAAHVNVLTTIAARYRDLKPAVSVSTAEQLVKRYLGLAESHGEYRLGHINISPYFNARALAQQAIAANGGSYDHPLYKFAGWAATRLETGESIVLAGSRATARERTTTVAAALDAQAVTAGTTTTCQSLPSPGDGKTWVPTLEQGAGMVSGVAAVLTGDPGKAFKHIGGALASFLSGGLFGDNNAQLQAIQDSLDIMQNELCNISDAIGQLQSSIDSMFNQQWYTTEWNNLNGNASSAGGLYVGQQWSLYQDLADVAALATSPLSPDVIESYFTGIGTVASTGTTCALSANLTASPVQVSNSVAYKGDVTYGGQQLNQTYLNLALKYYLFNDPYLAQSTGAGQLVLNPQTLQGSIYNAYANLSKSYAYTADIVQKALVLESEWVSYCTAKRYGLKPLPGNTDYQSLVHYLANDQSANSLANLSRNAQGALQPMAAEFMRGVEAIRSLDINDWTTGCCKASTTWYDASDYRSQAWALYLQSLGYPTSAVFELALPYGDRANYQAGYLYKNASAPTLSSPEGFATVVWPFQGFYLTPLADDFAYPSSSTPSSDSLHSLWITGANKDWVWPSRAFVPRMAYVLPVGDGYQGQSVPVYHGFQFDATQFYTALPFFPSSFGPLWTPVFPGNGSTSGSTFVVATQSDPTLEGVVLVHWAASTTLYTGFYGKCAAQYVDYYPQLSISMAPGPLTSTGGQNQSVIACGAAKNATCVSEGIPAQLGDYFQAYRMPKVSAVPFLDGSGNIVFSMPSSSTYPSFYSTYGYDVGLQHSTIPYGWTSTLSPQQFTYPLSQLVSNGLADAGARVLGTTVADCSKLTMTSRLRLPGY